MGYKSVGYCQGTSISTSQSLAAIATASPLAGIPTTSDFLIMQAEAQTLRYRSDGVSPTASVGDMLAAGDSVVIRRAQYPNLQVIGTAAGAIVNIDFCKTG